MFLGRIIKDIRTLFPRGIFRVRHRETESRHLSSTYSGSFGCLDAQLLARSHTHHLPRGRRRGNRSKPQKQICKERPRNMGHQREGGNLAAHCNLLRGLESVVIHLTYCKITHARSLNPSEPILTHLNSCNELNMQYRDMRIVYLDEI